jgi:hypothetical protein
MEVWWKIKVKWTHVCLQVYVKEGIWENDSKIIFDNKILLKWFKNIKKIILNKIF